MAVGFDAASAGTGANNVASFTWTHTPVGSPSGVGVGYAGYAGNAGTRTVTATYGGTSMTTEISNPGSPFVTRRTPHLFSLGNPAAGAQTVVVACSGAGMYGIPYAVTVTGGDTSDVISNTASATGSSATPSVTVTTASDELVMDVCVTGNVGGGITVGANQTSRASSYSSISTWAMGSTQAGSDGGDMSWAISSAAWEILAMSFKAAGAAATSLPPVSTPIAPLLAM